MDSISLDAVLAFDPEWLAATGTHAPGPPGRLPYTPEQLRHEPSGNLFGWSQNAGMGWPVGELGRPEILLLSTHGGVRGADGSPIALGLHTGHWEVNELVAGAATELKRLGAIPFAAFCTDPCDGRTQGTTGMFDSLPYRNDAATIFRRLIRSLPTRKGVIGAATCDKGLPAMMMALAAGGDLPCVLIPGGVTLLPAEGEDAGRVQTIGARFAHGYLTLEQAQEVGCRACATPGGGCQFLGTAATAQVVGEALGMTVPHAALAPSGQRIWREMAVASARAVLRMGQNGTGINRVLSEASIRNAMAVYAAFGGSTNLLIHLPAIAHAAGMRRPAASDWADVCRQVPRLVDALPNGPQNFATVQVFLAGGVPEVMLHLRRTGLLDTGAKTVSGASVNTVLDWWEQSDRRRRMRRFLSELDGIDPDQVIMSPDRARAHGLTPTVCFPSGNLAPEGCVVKSTSIDPSLIDQNGCYRKRGRARVFASEHAAIEAIKQDRIGRDDVLILIGRGPMGAGMEEIYQITSALKHLPTGKHVAVVTDARFSGVSTGACLGHVSPEALAGGPVGKLRDGDLVEIVVDRKGLTGSVNFIGEGDEEFDAIEGSRRLAGRERHPEIAPDPALPSDTKLWALLQSVSGGVWGGCVFDLESIGRMAGAGQERGEPKG